MVKTLFLFPLGMALHGALRSHSTAQVVVLESSLAIDSNDNLHVTYLDFNNDNLEYMTYDGSSWSTPVSLDSTGLRRQ